MSHNASHAPRREWRGGIESALQGLASLVTPSLLFLGFLGPLAATPGLWGTLLAVALLPCVRLLCGGSAHVMAAPRTASSATFVAMVLHMGLALSNSPLGADSAALSLPQLRLGLAAAGLMYLMASVLVALSGMARLGRVFTMIPTPVTTGISNGTALLLLWLAVGKMAQGGVWVGVTAACMLLSSHAWGRVQPRWRWTRVLPSVLLAMAVGMLLATLGSAGGAVAGSPATDLWQGAAWTAPALWPELAAGRLGTVLMLGLPGSITLALVMVLETFTTRSVMEIRFGARSVADRELLALGLSNMVGAVLGGIPSTGSPVYSVAAWLAGGRGRVAALVSLATSAGLVVAFGPQLLALPAGLAAGLLVMQAGLMVNPAFTASLWTILRTGRWRRPASQDLGFWIALLISLVGFFGNLIWACFAGVGLSCLAVLRRVSVNLAAQWQYLDALRSRRIRSPAASDALSHLAQHVGVLRLTGHLFFGNSGRITQLADELHAHCQCVVVDVSQVHDADPSGVDAVAWLLHTVLERRIRVVLVGLGRSPARPLQNALADMRGVEQRVDLDRGLELCEDWVLQHATALPPPHRAHAVAENSLLQGLDAAELHAVLQLALPRQVGQGQALFRKDAVSDGVWLLQSGQVSILAGSGQEAMRLATFGPGQFVGEMGFVDGNTRSATATADTDVDAVLLDKQAIAALVRTQPQAVLKITGNIARALSHRVRSASALQVQVEEAPSSVWGSTLQPTVA